MTFTYFRQNQKKEGGTYFKVTGVVKRIDGYTCKVALSNGQRISIEDILSIQFEGGSHAL